jgi:predicted metal-dependent HD superfamily phosphohydrolase
MSAPEVELRTAWQHLAGVQHGQLLDHLLGRLREPHRHYHTATHVMWVLRHIDHIGLGLPDAVPDVAAVNLAALFHDAVYDPTRSDNEVISAVLAQHVAGELGWSTDRAASVHRLVMATAAHSPAAADEAVLVDADLAILGAEPKDYAAYVQGVRAEYAHVSAEQWRVGRADVLRRFLAAPALFHTDVMRHERGIRATANLTAELASLTSR